jgi:hypothetical protein
MQDRSEGEKHPTAVMKGSVRSSGYEVLNMVNTLGTRCSGRAFSHRVVLLQSGLAGSSASFRRFDTKDRAHSDVSAGTPAVGKVRVDKADGEALFCWAIGRSASDGAPKDGRALARCLLVGCAVRFDIFRNDLWQRG